MRFKTLLISLILSGLFSISAFSQIHFPIVSELLNKRHDVLPTNYIQTYPNPTAGPVLLQFKESYALLTVEIRSYTGQLMGQQVHFNKSKIKLDLEGPSGMYYIKVTADSDHVVMYRVSKQ